MQWSGLLFAIFGGWGLAAGEGTARVFTVAWAEVVGAQTGVAHFYAALIGVPFAPFVEGGTISTAWTDAATSFAELGPPGVMLFAFEILLFAWLVGEGVDRVV